MSVTLEGGTIRLTGSCPVEDAEPLLALLQTDPDREVDIGGAGSLHTAVVQVLLACRPTLRGVPGDGFVARWIAPHLLGRPKS